MKRFYKFSVFVLLIFTFFICLESNYSVKYNENPQNNTNLFCFSRSHNGIPDI